MHAILLIGLGLVFLARGVGMLVKRRAAYEFIVTQQTKVNPPVGRFSRRNSSPSSIIIPAVGSMFFGLVFLGVGVVEAVGVLWPDQP
jgi:F0F1-type ATP synthase membrane subunit c/vacuolar-type H+-ATPase subunit K